MHLVIVDADCLSIRHVINCNLLNCLSAQLRQQSMPYSRREMNNDNNTKIENYLQGIRYIKRQCKLKSEIAMLIHTHHLVYT